MESNLEKHMGDIMHTQGVKGALCMDSNGLPLHSTGVASTEDAGLLSSIAQQAQSLCPDQPNPPVVVLESDTGNIIMKKHDNITLAIHKSPSASS